MGKILGLSGKLSVGKDEVAKMIIKADNSFKVKRYSGKLKMIAELLTGIPAETMNDQKVKEQYLGDDWGMDLRLLLQKLGTEAIRDGLHKQAWINAMFADVKESDNIVITDVRFPNELEAIKKRGGITVRIERGVRAAGCHASETSLDNADFDYWIDNNGSLEDLEYKVNFFMSKIYSNGI
jgi:dephospho-CoA kinase